MPGGLNCAESDHPDFELLEKFASGLLSGDDSDRIERHLSSCAVCAEQIGKVNLSNDSVVDKLRRMAQHQVQPHHALVVKEPHAAEASNGSPHEDITLPPKNDPLLKSTVPDSPHDLATTRPDPVKPDTGDEHNPDSPTQRKVSAEQSYRMAPENLGRYRIVKLLGQGGFGEVYQGYDDQLKRSVAIKVTLQQYVESDSQQFLDEAQILASLDHPHIVPIYDIGQTTSGDFYIVSKLIDGGDLAGRIKTARPTRMESIDIVASIAEALHHAHGKGLVHRDVKPANILIDNLERVYLTDFGIALREQQFGSGSGHAGTPAFMSPEQARGEGHRVDGRSDIYSLGVVFYELLSGRRPFQSNNNLDLMLLISENEVKPLRQFDASIPPELERICLKALALRATDRYSTGADMAEELRSFALQFTPIPRNALVSSSDGQALAMSTAPATPTGPTRVVPKGLRSFDQNDSDFFLDLLPGPRDRAGLPDSLRFWKTKIESPETEESFSVGLVYGPSGCGKSSLMKAGLLPRFSANVVSVYIEATSDDTELRLLRSIQKKLPSLAGDRTLKDTLTAVRRGQGLARGKKLLLVIDQFEQWLHAKDDYRNTELTAVLRQCDGIQIQCIVMVRDDFWLSVSRFMRELEADIESQNSLLVDLFDLDHSAKVLGLFGRAFGKLLDSSSQWTKDQNEFIRQAVNGLAQDRKVVSVRIALFAEMMKSRDWTTAALREVGGTQGIGTTFLEETFSATTAPPQHRLHQKAARSLLAALLPEPGCDIKGHMRSKEQLLIASGYEQRPRDFDDLIRILDSEVRLITPAGKVESEELQVENEVGGELSTHKSPLSTTPCFQLTHDYLVPSLRDWLTRKQKETRKGRAELKLEERSAIWNAKRENKQLPTVPEWFSIRVLTASKRWTESQHAMMSKAARVHGVMWGGLLLTVLLVGVGIQQWASAERWKNLQDQTRAAAESLQNNLGPTVSVNLKELGKLPTELVLPELRSRFTSATNARHKLSLAFALAGYGELDAEYLASRIDDIAEADTSNYITALQANPTTALVALKAEALKCIDKPRWRRKTKFAIAALGLGNTELAHDVCAFENRPDPEQRTLFIDEFPRWDIDLEAVLGAIKNIDSPALRSGMCLAVGQFPVEKIIDADKESWKRVASQWFVEHGDTSTHSAAGWLLRHWMLPLPAIPMPYENTPQRDWFVVKTNGATMLRIRSALSDVSEIPNPIQTYEQQLKDLEGVDVAELEKPEYREYRGVAYFQTGQLEKALVDFQSLTKDGAAERQPTILQYVTLTLARLGRADEAKASLATYLQSDVPASYKLYMQIQVPAWLGDIPEASRQLESALNVALSQDAQYNVACAAALCAQATAKRDSDQSQQFRIRALDLLQQLYDFGYRKVDFLSKDPDFAVLHGDPQFVSILSAMKSLREFWVGDREVTRGQFEQFMNDANYAATEKPLSWEGVNVTVSPTADHPAQNVSWYDAVMYCNWLSLREGLNPCYQRTGTKEKGIHDETEHDAWRLIPGSTGYRLLQEAEWEYACRAGSTTEYSSGDDETLLLGYCQMSPSRLAATCGEKLQNAWGLHDVHGNVWEWCENLFDFIGGSSRESRGGDWFSLAENCLSAVRSSNVPTDRTSSLGFRLALSASYGQSTEAVK